MIKIGIIGGAGYTAGELLRILVNHPKAKIVFVQSQSNSGNMLSYVHSDLIGETDLTFCMEINDNIDVVFLCSGHGKSIELLTIHSFPNNVKIIDLSNDFRLNRMNEMSGRKFIYGLPELNETQIAMAQNIANPGCFATCIQLAILPLAALKLLSGEIHVNAITGATGAGQKPTSTTHFSWRDNNISTYKMFQHQHIDEIEQSIKQLQPYFNNFLNFVPVRGNFSRGIFGTIYTDTDKTIEELKYIYNEFYRNSPFTYITDEEIDLKQVVNTNKCLLHLQKINNKVIITSIIDNLLKGASGQAVENMNIMYGLDRTTGLKLKSIGF